MNITDITNAYIYLEDARSLAVTGSLSSPKRIILSETDGASILDELHYANFDGQIVLDIADILAAYTAPCLPGEGWEDSEDICLPMTFTIGDTSYPFHFLALSADSQLQMTDIDMIHIPYGMSIPVSVFSHQDSECQIFLETSAGRVLVDEYLFPEDFTGISCRRLAPSLLPADYVPFRLVCKVTGTTTTERTSPLYVPTSEDFQLYLFRNRFGALEIFPMRGALEFAPAFKFESGKNGRSYKGLTAERDDLLRQYSGNLTCGASRALASFLKDGYAYHLVDGEWRRIVIEEASIVTKTSEAAHRQSFSFRYQDPVELSKIM